MNLRSAAALVIVLSSLAVGAFADSLSVSDTDAIVQVVTIDGVINPVSTRAIQDAIDLADETDAEALIIELDTPGGLLKSVHEISKSILAAPVPVIVYVAPEGARATSAGVLVTISAHVAAMARGTHIGAAHVVGLQGAIPDSIVNEKAMNDWVAELQSVARLRGRNEEWVERAARESESVIAAEALELGVIDLIAVNVDSLLAEVDGVDVEVEGQRWRLQTEGATVLRINPGFRERFLNVISDPSVAYILFLIGIYGLIFELSNPGSILPGIAGAICIILALYAMHSLPINYAGVLLILLGLAMFVAETQISSFGLLTLGGVAALTTGSILLLDRAGPLFKISIWVILPAVAITTFFFTVALSKALLAQRTKPVSGEQGLVGERGVAKSDLSPDGRVYVHGEIWRAHSASPVRSGDEVEVVGVDGLQLEVKGVRRGAVDT